VTIDTETRIPRMQALHLRCWGQTIRSNPSIEARRQYTRVGPMCRTPVARGGTEADLQRLAVCEGRG
jgi:hypothetical protein